MMKFGHIPAIALLGAMTLAAPAVASETEPRPSGSTAPCPSGPAGSSA